MSEFTSGPWTKTGGSWEYSKVYGPDGSEIAMVCIHSDVTEDNQVVLERIKAANSPLIVAAPAQALALDLMVCGLARIERSMGTPNLSEFCFDGIRYVLDDPNDWNITLNVIGWDRARAAIDKAKGSR